MVSTTLSKVDAEALVTRLAILHLRPASPLAAPLDVILALVEVLTPFTTSWITRMMRKFPIAQARLGSFSSISPLSIVA